MALIIEDGTIVANANSYVTAANLDTYLSDRGLSITASTTADKEELLIRAMDYLELQRFLGVKFTRDQALQWPRVSVVIDGYLVDSDTIPELLKEAQMETTITIDGGNDPLELRERLKRRTQVGSVSVEYESGSDKVLRKVNNKLRKLIKAGGLEVVKG